ncbi:hypothetical protein [Parendozoicomonas haliclonae]|uniref:Invasion associated locus B (IalB) protein n=1 Tax=Parendozoicomonas haliclonae TaxID=1960125 RepID=A0A1X7AQR1_9GAMM|nr:hypothetical protein [Parendozoicomonas haliclonae]SMA50575.1 hypothetical protein EHSB41UT_04386 [Parendozoicomonas haliclonae]
MTPAMILNHARFTTLPLLLALFIATLLPSIAQAKWSYSTFQSGSLTHWIAASDSNRDRQLELFCSRQDKFASLALYVPEQRFSKREPIEIFVRIDKQKNWKLTGFRHAMAVIAPDTPQELIRQLAKGNKVLVTYETSEKEKESFHFPLNGSANALYSLQQKCHF